MNKTSQINQAQWPVEEQMKFKTTPILTIASYNVMFPPRTSLFRAIINPQTRFDAQLNEVLPQLNADIYCIQEASEMFIETFKNSKLFKDGYQCTPIDPNRTEVHSPLIISRLPFTCLFVPKYEINKIKRFAICLFTIEDINIIVISAHLTSYETNIKGRQEEMRLLDRVVKALPDKQKDKEIKDRIKNAFSNRNVILCGDLNLHYPSEDRTFERVLFHDLWLERHSHFDGLTWDPCTNKMFWRINPFDTRRLRLDRICMYQSRQLDLEDIEIFGNKCIGYGTESEKQNLFPSDHFGIISTIIILIVFTYSKIFNLK